MSITINPTLPQEWKDNITYEEGNQVVYGNSVSSKNKVIYQSIHRNIDGDVNRNKNPIDYPDYWKALDIYKKDSTVMPHGQYSGDDSFWERDEIKISQNGQVFVNGENTGINVRGPAGSPAYIRWEDLTPEQKAELRGEAGLDGTDGHISFDDLTPGQIAQLKGSQGIQGKSSYEIWLEQGHTGTIDDYFSWIMENAISVDTELDEFSTNPVENKVITNALESYKAAINEYVKQCNQRITALENRLKYVYDNIEHEFKFGITQQGEYGYFYNNSATIIPFNKEQTELLMSVDTQPLLGLGIQSFGQSDYTSNVSFLTVGENIMQQPSGLNRTISTSVGESPGVDFLVPTEMYGFNEEEWSRVKTDDVTDLLMTDGLNLDLTSEPFPKGNVLDPEATGPDSVYPVNVETWNIYSAWINPGNTKYFMYGVTVARANLHPNVSVGGHIGQHNITWDNGRKLADVFISGSLPEYVEEAGVVTHLGFNFDTEEATYYIHAGHETGWWIGGWDDPLWDSFNIVRVTGYYIDNEEV